jgi:protoporphyrinogen oxidase
MSEIAILGAGIGGLSAAWDLVRAGHTVTIYEASGEIGGLASGFKDPSWDWSLEKFYHHWFQSDKHMLGLIDELGWSDQVLFPRPYTVMYYDGKFYPFDAIPQMALFPGLGWGINKVRFGLVGLYLRLTNNWRELEKTTVDAWMRRWAGNQVYELMWEPMMVGKFGERYAKTVNMAWMWARIKSRTTRLGTFTGGFQAFCDQFADRLRSLGVTIRLNTPVERIESDPHPQPLPLKGEGGEIHSTPLSLQGRLPSPRRGEGLGLGVRVFAGSESRRFDQVLSTTSPALMAKLAPSLPDDYLRGLLDLKSLGAVVMVIALKRKLSPQGYYWYNIPKNAGFPFLALVEHTNYLPSEHYGGDHLLYVGDYLETDHEHFRLSQDELLERFLPSFTRINPDFKPDWVRKTWLFRTAYAQPVPEVNHSQHIPAIQTPMPGLYFASMSQVYPWDRGTNFAVEIGRRAAGLMLGAK